MPTVREVIASRKQGAIYWINQLRERAGNALMYGQAILLMTMPSSSSSLNERARELYHEGYRRTDLIRYGQFTTNKYIWQWKGGDSTTDRQWIASTTSIHP